MAWPREIRCPRGHVVTGEYDKPPQKKRRKWGSKENPPVKLLPGWTEDGRVGAGQTANNFRVGGKKEAGLH